MKSLVGELTENEKWSIKGTLMGECWHRDCCLSDYKGHKRCGKSGIWKPESDSINSARSCTADPKNAMISE